MKKYLLFILCVCSFLLMMASEAPFDSARQKSALNSDVHIISSSAGDMQAVSLSLTQYLREHNLSLNDNQLAKKRPSLLSLTGGNNTMIAAMEVRDVDIDLETGDIQLGDVYSMGWQFQCHGYDDFAVAESIYDGFNLPILIDDEISVSIPVGVKLDSIAVFNTESVHVDTISGLYVLPVSWLMEDDADYTDIVGTVFDDGSVLFDDGFLFVIEQELLQYRHHRLIRTDTCYYVSPVINSMCLLIPNGIHSFNEKQKKVYSGELVVTEFDKEPFGQGGIVPRPIGSKPIKPSSPSSSPNLTTIKRMEKVTNQVVVVGRDAEPKGNGGKVHRPIDPRPSQSSSSIIGMSFNDPQQNVVEKVIVIDQEYEPTGNGGRVYRPIDPKPMGHVSESYGYAEMGDIQLRRRMLMSQRDGGDNGMGSLLSVPVYLFQADDSTVLVYNLYGKGVICNEMKLHPDSTLWFSGQVIEQRVEAGSALSNYYYNFSIEDSEYCKLSAGNMGRVASDYITWGGLMPCSLNGSSGVNVLSTMIYYTDNVLSLLDGQEFVIPGYIIGDVNADGHVSIGDVTDLIDGLLDGGNTINLRTADVNADGQVTIGDVTSLIDKLLDGTTE